MREWHWIDTKDPSRKWFVKGWLAARYYDYFNLDGFIAVCIDYKSFDDLMKTLDWEFNEDEE